MVRIGVLADTHLAADSAACRAFAGVVAGHFAGVEMILHAGDIVDPGLLAVFAPTPVYAVRGNMDPATADTPPRRIVSVAGVRIGLIHGWGAPAGVVARVVGAFADTPLDVLVFGHTHEPCCRWQDGLLLFNPGSATDRRRMPYESVGILEIAEGRVRGRIIQLSG